jgi:hypothetical protein
MSLKKASVQSRHVTSCFAEYTITQLMSMSLASACSWHTKAADTTTYGILIF